MLKTNNDYLNILLCILLILVMIQEMSVVTRLKGYHINVPQTVEQLYTDPFLLPEKKVELSKSAQLELLQQAQMLRRISKSTPIQIVRYQEPKIFVDRYMHCYHQQPRDQACISFLKIAAEYPRIIKVPENSKPMILVLHSDLPIHWQFGTDHKDAKLIFMTGALPSEITGSTFSSNIACLNSFQHGVAKEDAMFCRRTALTSLQKFEDMTSYQYKVEKVFQRKPQEVVILGK